MEALGEGLGRIGGLLASVSTMIAALAPAVSAQTQRAAALRRGLDSAEASIEDAIRAVEEGQHIHGHHFRVTDLAPDLQSFDIEHAIVNPHDRLDVTVNVRASAQMGGLLLSFGDLGILETLTLRILGVRGAAEITAVSGASVLDLAAAIGTMSELTGVGAFVNGTGVELVSLGCGSDLFVGVQVLSTQHLSEPSGIYRMLPDNFLLPNPTTCIPLTSGPAHTGVWDFGQDIRADINGHPAQGRAASMSLWTPRLRLELTLSEGAFLHAFHLGSFVAFRISRD